MPNTLDEMEWIKLKALEGSLYLQLDPKDIFPLRDLTNGPVSLWTVIFSSKHTGGAVNIVFIVYILYVEYELYELTKILLIAWTIIDPSGALVV